MKEAGSHERESYFSSWSLIVSMLHHVELLIWFYSPK